MASYLRYHRGTWDDDADLLIIVGSCMKGATREWFDNRAEDLCDNRKVDNFVAFMSAMGERFKTDKDDINFDKLHNLQNKGVILKYINNL